ncbi:Non-ribosomal peptide synthetase [Xenorhabdus innexi]|uniref:Amino acid adenylation n=2 Tax=Xenorhabdus innexi TaxID=290109 RepID=A0A1N6MVN4_9GAMM|nr:non-ribosomal peptide synthetase [Xenorhabdus innexi]PHM35753.1 Amino acid adenylation [Xenorhabdus innexi]SIP72925.1 Non-ribosomal peptide synthetase [Xenorhabdus innexi]
MSQRHNSSSAHGFPESSSATDNNSSPLFHPLSSVQQAIWFDQVSHPEHTDYHIGFFIGIEGEFNEALFIRAFDTIVGHRDSLRLQFINTHTLPTQIVADSLPVSVSIHDFSSYPDAEVRAKQHLDARFSHPFYLNGMLWRSELLKVNNTHWYWHFCCHHLILDGSSLFILLDDVINAYNCLVKGEPLDKSFPSYLDFIKDEQTYLTSRNYTDHLQFWLKRYENLPSPLLNPVKPNQTIQHRQGQPVLWPIEQTLLERIKNIAAEQGSSILYVIYAVLACYFSRTTGVDEIVIGVPTHNRKNPRQKETIGVFTSLLPIKVNISPEDTFRDVMHKAKAEMRSCYKYHRVPIVELNRQTHCQQKTGRSQLFDISLSFESFKTNLHLVQEGASVTCFKIQNNTPSLLAVRIKQYTGTALPEDAANFVAIEFNYSSDYLNTTEVTTLRSRFAALLDAALTSPDIPIMHLPVLPEEERQKVLVDFNTTQADFPQEMMIHQLFEAQVQRSPDAIAVVFENQFLSYAALNRRANQLAHYLISLGVKPDDRVAVCVERNLDIIVSFLGILKAGGAYVPLDSTYPVKRLNWMLDDSAPRVLITQNALANQLSHQTTTIVLDIRQPFLTNQPEHNPNLQSIGLTSHHLAYVIYTSGSTGQPKGVMIEHHSLCNIISTQKEALDITPNSRVLQFASNSSDSSIWEFCLTLLTGACLYLAKPAHLRPGEMLFQYLETHRITHVPFLTPTALMVMKALPATVEVLVVAGEACPLTLVKRWAGGRKMFNGYGPTEATITVTLHLCDSQTENIMPIGRPIANTQIYILDSHDQIVPMGVTGELYIGGVSVARGYLNRPDLTAERFLPDPFSDKPNARMYKTGDLGRWLPDGVIEYLGRNDFQIKLRGFRIELAEIENHLTQCDGVHEAVVLVCGDQPDEKWLAAYIIAEPNTELTPGALHRQLGQYLAAYMIPRAFVVLDAFPFTPNGKLDRQRLPIPEQDAFITRHYAAPTGEAEIALSQIWQTLLGIARVSRHDHFFELGGHSLRAVSLIEQLHGLGWVLDIRNVFATPILKEMAKAMSTKTVKPAIKQGDATDFTVPPNFIPAGCHTITPDMLTLVSLSQSEIDTIVATVSGGAANIQDIYPLTPPQEGILFHSLYQAQSEIHGDTYLLRTLLAFNTRDRLNHFLAAVQQVINRHDSLRTAVCWQELTQPVQVVWRQATLNINTFTVSDSGQDAPSQLLAHTDLHRQRLNLNQAPLFSADIAYDPYKDEWLLVLRFHHLVSDHITLELMIAEISQLLSVRDEAHHLVTLPPVQPYRNFVAQTLRQPASIHENYFRDKLADIDTPTILFGISDIHSRNKQVTESSHYLDALLTKAIHKQSQRQGVNPSVLFHVALAQVLAKINGSEDVVFGTVLLGRLGRMKNNAVINQMMGLFINTLPIRFRLTDNSPQKIVRETYHYLMELLEHEQAPLTLAQRCSGVAPPLPLFNTLLNYRHSRSETPFDNWEDIRQIMIQSEGNYPFYLAVDDLNEKFRLVCQTVSGIDPTQLLTYITTALTGLVEALATEPQKPLSDITILPARERQQLLRDFNATYSDFTQSAFKRSAFKEYNNVVQSDPASRFLIHKLFEAQAQRTPDATAVVFEEHSLSYRELNQRANHLAHYLIAQDIHPDDRVALCTERSLNMIIGVLGILKSGAAYVPLEPTYPTERLAYILADAAPVLLLTQNTVKNRLNCTIPTVILDDFTQSCISPESINNPDIRTLGLTSHHLAYIIYTSGSTGQPKGVMVEHRSVCNYLLWALEYGLTEQQQDGIVSSPLAFDATVTSLYLPILCGGKIHLLRDGQELTGLLPLLLSLKSGALVKITPSHFSAIGQELKATGRTCPAHCFVVAGETLPSNTVALWNELSPDSRIINEYGPTETTVGCTIFDTQHPSCFIDNVPIGHPIANTRIYILDQHGDPVPIGVEGELYIGGNGVARGYLNQPELTAERFLPDHFSTKADARLYKTGDLGRWLPDGTIEYLGRNDFQVKLRGFRIELREIETKLREYSGVRDAVVIIREHCLNNDGLNNDGLNNDGLNNDRLNNNGLNKEGLNKNDLMNDKHLIAYVQPQPDTVLTPAELRHHLAQQFTEYMLPSAFVILDAFPLTHNGKLNRQALPAPEQNAFVTRNYAAPMSTRETVLAEIWQTLLGPERVGRYDHFFELGGHSLTAVNLLEQLRSRGWSLDLSAVFARPVLADMAEKIQAIQDKNADSTVPPNLIPAECTTITPDMLSLVSLSQHEIDIIATTVTGGAANIQDIYPLAPLQEGILFHYMMQQQGDTYLLRHLLTFDSRIRLDTFLAALQQIINRHDILRTSFYWEELSQPVQIVWRQAPLHIKAFVPDDESDIQAQLLAYTDPLRRRMDIRQAPLFAIDIAYESHRNEWLLALSFHHLVNDNITVRVIINEMHKLLHNSAAPLTIPLPYRNFVAQSLRVSLAEYEAYFRELLADVDTPTAPFGIVNVHSENNPVTAVTQSLDTALSRAIRLQANRQGVSASVLFHVAWARVLAKISGQEEVIFGTVLLGHMQENTETEQGIGLFINTLPIRIRLMNNSVQDIVQATYQSLIGLLEHEQAPLALVQRCSGIKPPLPLFSTLLNYRHNQQDMTLDTWEGIRLKLIPERTNYPVTLSVDDLVETFQLVALSVDSIEPNRLINYMTVTLSGLVKALESAPQQAISNITILPAAERQQLLTGFNTTKKEYPQDKLIQQLFETQAQRTPDNIAVIFEEQSLRYEELNRRANRLAHYLIAQGIKPDDRIAICAERSLEMVIMLLAILKAGAAYVPLNPEYPTNHLEHILTDSEPALILSHHGLQRHLPGTTVPLLIWENQIWENRIREDKKFQPYSENQWEENPSVADLGLTSRNLAYVLYTSGSTGLPKGVMNEHRAVINRLLWAKDEYQLAQDDRVLQKTPFSFDVSVWEFFLPLLSGAQLVMARPDGHKDPRYLQEEIEARGITTIHFVPSMLQSFIHFTPPECCASLRQILCSGEPLTYSLQQQCQVHFPDSALHNLYGPTEAAIDVTAWRCNAEKHVGLVPIGYPIANTQIYILDKYQQAVPVGVTGEIYIGGIGVARGYLNRPELTAKQFIHDPFSPYPDARMYKSGDLGRWLPDGSIDYQGRNDFLIKIRGVRIEPGEIEAKLRQYPGVRDAVVIAREQQSGDKRLIAYVLTAYALTGQKMSEPETEPVPAILYRHLSKQLPDYMLPDAFVTLDTFPLTLSGKLDRQALPEPDQFAIVTSGYEPPVGDIETTLVQIWQKLLKIEQIGRHDNFFELGGNSLIMMQLIVHIQTQFFINITIAELFNFPTLREQASVILSIQINTLGEENPEALKNISDLMSPEELAKIVNRSIDK